MNEWSELLKAIATLLWPVLSFVALIIFHKEIAKTIGRIKKGKFLGQEIELSEELLKLQQSATEASEEVSSLSKNKPLQENGDEGASSLPDNGDEITDIIRSIIDESGRSPIAALFLLATEVEKEAKLALASSGKLGGRSKLSLQQIINELDSHYGLPKHVASSLRLFWDTRNKIIHGAEADERNIFSAIDSGIIILRSLQAIPNETSWVHNEGVEVYSDENCQKVIQGVKGIILKTASTGGSKISYRIYPSTRAHFKKGKKVAWEWTFANSWSNAWYKDPESGEIKCAWSSSAEFIGRCLDDI